MYYLLHGPEEFLRNKAIAELKATVGPPDLRDLNTTLFDGSQVTFAELVHACDAIPFLSERRLVIVEGLAKQLSPGRGSRSLGDKDKAFLENLIAHIPHLPSTNDLVLSEQDIIPASHPLHKVAQASGGQVRAFASLRGRDLERWIHDAARDKALKMERQAVAELAEYVGNNLRLLDLELDKLATYANADHLVTARDVHRLVSYVKEKSIFELVDALGQKDSTRAVQIFHQLLEDATEPLYISAMITRQFRLLLQTRAVVQEHGTRAQLMEALETRHSFVVDKMLSQARNFSLGQLKAIYRHLQRLDVGIKTGQVDAALGLDVLIAEVCRGRSPVRNT